MSTPLAGPRTEATARVDIGDALTDMWRSVLLFLPKAVAFLAILLVGWLVAVLLRRATTAVLTRVNFDQAVQRGGIGQVLQRTSFDASVILAKLVFYAVILLTLQLAFGVWGPNPVSDLIAGVVAWLPKAFIAIVIIVVAAAIGSAVRDLVIGALGGLSYGRLLANLAAWFIIGLGTVAALNQVGIATTVTTPVLIAVLATLAGIAIVGIGGGMVRPMQQRWERWLDRVEAESSEIRQRAQSYAAQRREAAIAGARTQGVPIIDRGRTGPRADRPGSVYQTGGAAAPPPMPAPSPVPPPSPVPAPSPVAGAEPTQTVRPVAPPAADETVVIDRRQPPG